MILYDLFQLIGDQVGIKDIADIKPGYANFVTFILAILLAMIAFIVNHFKRKSEFRHENSSKFIAAHKENVMEALKVLNKLSTIEQDTETVLKFIRENIREFMTAVTHFETVSVYIATGHASEKLVFMVEGGNMARLFESISKFTLDARKDEPRALIHFEGLYLRYTYGSWSILAWTLNLIYWDKILSYRRAFLIHYGILQMLNGYQGHYLEENKGEIKRTLYPLRIFLNAIIIIGSYSLLLILWN